MKHNNPQLPEGINTSGRHPRKEFALLAAGALLLLVFPAWLFGEFGGRLARLVPFESGVRLVPDGMLGSVAGAELQQYIDGLAARIATEIQLSDEMVVKVHVSGAETFNAFANLGGNVLLYRRLLEKLPHENALAVLIALETAHVLHRDPGRRRAAQR